MTSLTRWTWVWVNSGSWWWTRRPGMLRFMGSQRVRHNWVTELTDWSFTAVWSSCKISSLSWCCCCCCCCQVASVVSDSVGPNRWQPTRLPQPWDSPGKNTGVGCHFLLQCIKVKSESEVTQSCLTLCDPMDCSLPGSSVHGIFQARVLECGAMAFSTLNCWSGNSLIPIFSWTLTICFFFSDLVPSSKTPNIALQCFVWKKINRWITTTSTPAWSCVSSLPKCFLENQNTQKKKLKAGNNHV